MKFGDITKDVATGMKTYHGGDYLSYSDFLNSTFALSMDENNFRLFKKEPQVFKAADAYRREYRAVEKSIDIKGLVKRFQKFRENRNVRLNVADSPRYDIAGEVFDAGRFISGDPECMINFYGDDATGARMVDIELAVGLPVWVAKLKDGEIRAFEHFAGVLDIIDQLESNGTRCQIIGSCVGHDGRENSKCKNEMMQYSFVFKKHSEIFDLEFFCKIFLTNLAGLSGLLISTMIAKMNAKDNYCSSYWISTDYQDNNVNRFDPNKPDLIKYPSLWRPWLIKFKKESAADILHELGYDII